MAASAPSFHIGEVGVSYTPVAFTATGGLAPYKWSVVSGALPGGLTIGSDGSVSGTPTAGGDFPFTVAVADSGTQSTTVDGKISIAAPLTASLIPACAQYCNVELGCANACGAFGSLSGGVGPFDFKLLGGDIPAGTSVVGLSLTGTFGGQTGWVQFTVQASDSLGATSTIAPKFWMYPHVKLSNGSCYSGYFATTPCTTSLPISGGIPGTAFSVSVASASGQLCTRTVTGAIVCNPSSNPPPGFTATVSGNAVSVNVPASPNYYFTYNGTVTLQLVDQDPCGQGTQCNTTGTVQVVIQGG